MAYAACNGSNFRGKRLSVNAFRAFLIDMLIEIICFKANNRLSLSLTLLIENWNKPNLLNARAPVIMECIGRNNVFQLLVNRLARLL